MKTKAGRNQRRRERQALTAASRDVAERVVKAARKPGLRVVEPGGPTARYVRIADASGKTIAYVEAHQRAEHELTLLKGDPAKIARALPEGRDAFTRRFKSVAKAARGVRAAADERAPARRREYVAA